ncbi:hypothetical protein [uncultured Methanobrevibacter sp.]|uniref:hypothetical protein n=1 Tax=uncultured Methanobrevibacter sp. TaxID=253161 RepID=UPI0026351985|nr:hypothetical protein [uncultured Methanobrevibacter sp.]
MREIVIGPDFDVDDTTSKISDIMSRWSVRFLDINGPSWVIYNQDMEVKCLFFFDVDFNDLETRIKLEDLKLNVIHEIEDLKDDTTYRDNLINEVFLD